MKKITQNELTNFFNAMKKNNLSYREEPRTQEEISNLIVVYNCATKQYYTLNKSSELKPEEKVVTPFEIFENITKDIDVVQRESDDLIM